MGKEEYTKSGLQRSHAKASGLRDVHRREGERASWVERGPKDAFEGQAVGRDRGLVGGLSEEARACRGQIEAEVDDLLVTLLGSDTKARDTIRLAHRRGRGHPKAMPS